MCGVHCALVQPEQRHGFSLKKRLATGADILYGNGLHMQLVK
jgi:hypothetical protein